MCGSTIQRSCETMMPDDTPSESVHIQPTREDPKSEAERYWAQYANNPMLQRALNPGSVPKGEHDQQSVSRVPKIQEYKQFCNKNPDVPDMIGASEQCLREGYTPLSLPEIIDSWEKIIGINEDVDATNFGITTISSIIIGKGRSSSASKKGGNKYAIFAHVPTKLSDPEYLKSVGT